MSRVKGSHMAEHTTRGWKSAKLPCAEKRNQKNFVDSTNNYHSIVINIKSHLPLNFVLTAQVSRPVYHSRPSVSNVITINLTVFLTLAYLILRKKCMRGWEERGRERILLISKLHTQHKPIIAWRWWPELNRIGFLTHWATQGPQLLFILKPLLDQIIRKPKTKKKR